MKALGIIAMAVAGFVAAPSPANAYVQQPAAPPAIDLTGSVNLVQRWDDGRGRYDRNRWDRGRRDYRRNYYRGRHYGWRNNRWRYRTVCHTRWRYGNPYRVCNRIRVRY